MTIFKLPQSQDDCRIDDTTIFFPGETVYSNFCGYKLESGIA
jgi:hypothetical protein